MLVHLSVGVAVLRPGLFGTDHAVNRALVYAALTAFMIVVYVGSVVVLLRTFVALTGGDSQPAVIAATLFVPAGCRIQRTMDRRFYRRKHDAVRALETFSAGSRDETDLDALSGHPVPVARETAQPAHASLWMRTPESGETLE
jgi:hypothetical protein